MPLARLAIAADLDPLLALFASSEVSPAINSREQAKRIWSEILLHRGYNVFVSNNGDRIVATCMLITAQNLLRGGKRHAFLENVVTHPEFQGRGYGRAVVQAALHMLGWMIAIMC